MREILFRGFHECEEGSENAFYNGEWHKGEWVYGKSILYLKENGGEYYMPKCDEKCKTIHLENGDIEEINCADYNTAFYKVAPETVCQYTGRDYKNGKKIFDGDIVKVFDRPRNRDVFGLIKFGIFAFNVLFYIDWEKTLTGSNILRTELGYWHDKIEIIGNKFENPELLEVEE